MTITGIITAIIVGLIIGALARLVLPGKQNISIILTILIGIVAAFIGTALARAVVDTDGFSFIELIFQVVVAVVGVGIVSALRSGRAR
ncbi:GlsB/YeaQ/YmgE family stress response membrane protein [Kineococcus sp. LSe6-4]|uniref:GlsB/YeaQ/YmgE family stress response membrane protein n=1 Tax=Kineococcus halophytocola TaxID=3234027 RepID=A0ABV4H3V7_9ACTN